MISANLHYLNLLDEPKQLILSVVLLQHLHSNHCASSLSINLNITLVHREKGQSKIVTILPQLSSLAQTLHGQSPLSNESDLWITPKQDP